MIRIGRGGDVRGRIGVVHVCNRGLCWLCGVEVGLDYIRGAG